MPLKLAIANALRTFQTMLPPDVTPSKQNLTQKILAAYHKKLYDMISSLPYTGDDEKDRATIINFLSEIETIVKGSMLYYTALPSAAKSLLCEIATAVSESAPADSPMTGASVLMPSLNLESKATTTYPSLCAVKVDPREMNFTKDDEDTLRRLQRVKAHAKNFSDAEQNQLLALEATKEQAEFYSEHTTQAVAGTTWRIPKLTLKEILTTHIVSEDRKDLIPVMHLLEQNPHHRLNPKPNPYSITYRCTSADEIRRLSMHSNIAGQYQATFDSLRELHEDQSNLLTQLTKLRQQLKISDAHGGRGTASSAAPPANEGIVAFTKYFEQLTGTLKNTIPEEVMVEIRLLLQYASPHDDKELNRTLNAEAIMATCTGTRGEQLEKLINTYAKQLSQIRLSAESKAQLVATREEALKEYAERLKKAPHGVDTLPITNNILKWLGVELTLSSLADLHQFMQMSASEIIELGKDPKLREAAKSIFKSEDEIITFLRETPDEMLTAYLSVLGNESMPCLKSIAFLKNIFFELNDSKKTIILNYLQTQWGDIIKSSSNLRDILLHLTDAQRTKVFETITTRLPDILKSFDDIDRTLRYLTPDQRTLVFAAIQTKLPNIIKSGNDLGYILHYLTPNQRMVVFAVIQTKLPIIIKSGDNLGYTLEYLTTDQRTVVCKAITPLLPDIIKSGDDLGRTLQYLTPDQCITVCKGLTTKLPDIIKSGDDLGCTLQNLTPDQCITVFKVIQTQLPDIIKSGEDLDLTLEHLTTEKGAALVTAVNDNYNKLVNTILESFSKSMQETYGETCHRKVAMFVTQTKEKCKNLIEQNLTHSSGVNLKEALGEAISKHTKATFQHKQPKALRIMADILVLFSCLVGVGFGILAYNKQNTGSYFFTNANTKEVRIMDEHLHPTQQNHK